MRIKLRKNQTTIEWEKVEPTIKQLEILADNLEDIRDLTKFSKLESLFLHCPNLTVFPMLPTTLKTLKVRSSKLPKQWLEHVATLHQLNIMQLSQTHLESLPPTFFKHMNDLTTLDLRGNKMEVIPQSFMTLRKLTRVNLDHNLLVDLPDGLYKMKQLHHISLDSNPLSDDAKQRLFESFGIWF